MRYIKKLLVFINYSNILISMAAGILTAGICILLNLNSYLLYGLFVFLNTFSVYNFQRILRAAQLKNAYSNHLNWINKNKHEMTYLLIVTSLTSIWVFWELFYLFKNTLLILFVGGFLSFFYVIKIKQTNLRNIPYLKMHLIATVWVCATGLIPLMMHQDKNNYHWLFALNHYFLISSICIAFDIRDLKYDTPNIKTLPQIIGINYSKIISIILLIIFTANSGLIFPTLTKNLLYVLCIAYLFFLLVTTSENKSEIHYAQLDISLLILGISYAM